MNYMKAKGKIALFYYKNIKIFHFLFKKLFPSLSRIENEKFKKGC